MRRRDFITLLGGAAAAWPIAARAQQAGKLPTVGMLGSSFAAFSSWLPALLQRLHELDWIENRTMAIEYRWTEGRNERYAQRLEILRELVPGLSRLGYIANVNNPTAMGNVREVREAAAKLALQIMPLDIKRAEDIAPAIETLKGRAQALYVVGDPLIADNQIQINTLALAARLPTMHGSRSYIASGGLMSYGPNYSDLFRRAGDYVDKILKGAKPAVLPVELPTRTELIVNLKTAKAISLTIPESFLVRADEVIE